MNELTEKRVLRLMSEHLGVERSALRDNACLMDLMDQLDFIELIMALEEEFGVELPDDIEDTVNGSLTPFDQIIKDGADGKLRGKSDEEILDLFKEASRKGRKASEETTVRQFLEIVAPFLP